MEEWQTEISSAKGTDRLGLVKAMIDDFKAVYVIHGDPLIDYKYLSSSYSTEVLKLHGIVRGIEGYMVLNIVDDEELEEVCIELSGDTWMPQLWSGGEFVGGWRKICEMHNAGSLVQVLEKGGLSSKLKGCYYEGKTPLVLHWGNVISV